MKNAERTKIFSDIRYERKYQDKKWGTSFDDKNTEENWIAYITEYLNGQGRALNYNFRLRMVKVAALAIAALEANDRKANKQAELSKKRDAKKREAERLNNPTEPEQAPAAPADEAKPAG